MKKQFLVMAAPCDVRSGPSIQVQKVNTLLPFINSTYLKAVGIIILALFSLAVNAQSNRNVEYYNSIFPELDGKIKYIDGLEIEYFNSVFTEFNGKVKSIGNTKIEYYFTVFPETNGKIKSIGEHNVEYYFTVFPENNGKIKSIGNIKFEYYNTVFENNGKLKSITNPDQDDYLLDMYYLVQKLNSKCKE